MLSCPQCGFTNHTPDTRFCENCGARLPQTDAIPDSPPIPQAETQSLLGDPTGEQLGEIEQFGDGSLLGNLWASVQDVFRSRTKLIVVIAIVVVVCCCCSWCAISVQGLGYVLSSTATPTPDVQSRGVRGNYENHKGNLESCAVCASSGGICGIRAEARSARGKR